MAGRRRGFYSVDFYSVDLGYEPGEIVRTRGRKKIFCAADRAVRKRIRLLFVWMYYFLQHDLLTCVGSKKIICTSMWKHCF